jgi:hypothetical protein
MTSYVTLGNAHGRINTLSNAPQLRYNSSNVFTMCNVGIGKSNVQYPLDVNGTIRATNIETSTMFLNGSQFLGTGYVGTIDNNLTNTYDINNTSNMHVLQNMFVQAEWGVGITNPSGVYQNDLCVDKQGNTYATGYVNSASSINSFRTKIYNANGLEAYDSNLAPFSIINTHIYFCFLIKFNAEGIAQWTACIDSQSGLDVGRGVAVDSNGNVYVCGTAAPDATFYHSTKEMFGVANNAVTGGLHGFLTKYDSNGMVQWFANVSSGTTFRRVAIDDSRNTVYVCGDYTSGSAQTIYNAYNVNSGATLPATDTNAACVIAYSTSGQYQWNMRVDGASSGGGRGVCVDTLGNVLFAGGYSASNAIVYSSDNAVFAPAMRAAANSAAFIVKADPSGVALLHVTQDTGSSIDIAAGVATDSSNNIIMTGNMDGSFGGAFYSYPNTLQNALPAGGGASAFVAKWSSDGDVVQWLGRVHTNNTFSDPSYNVVTDKFDNVYVCGKLASNTTIKDATNSSGFPFSIIDGFGSFVAKWNSLGVPQYGLALDSSGNDEARGVYVDASGNVYMSGNYSGSNVRIYNQNSVNLIGAVSTVVTLPPSVSVATFIVKYVNPPYKMWSNLSSENNGLIKTLLNDSIYPVTVDVTSSNNTNVLGSTSIEVCNAAQYVWNNTKWFKLQ